MEKATPKWKYTNIELAPNCPRCASSNTKFCYYNNYSMSQPRYFCKGCRRYWTMGGSLRSVPVGGGCRKSRRARAVARQGGGASYAGLTVSSACMASNNESNGSAYIDIDAVFAKYVKQNVENEESFSPGDSSGSSDSAQASSLETYDQMKDITTFEYQKPLDLMNDQVQQVVPRFPMCHDIIGQDFACQDSVSSELQQGVLLDELVADVLWSEGTSFPNFASQQSMVQVQDFELFSPGDQLKISANLTDNWGSFDLSTYEFCSTP